MHGAGTRVREEAGTRNPVGRPPVTGLYSADAPRTLAELRAEVVALNVDLDDTDDELRTIKATLAFLFRQSDQMTAKSVLLEAACDAVEQVLAAAPVVTRGVPGETELTVAQARALGEQLAVGRRWLAEINTYAHLLVDASTKSVSTSKMRAETRAKRAEAEALKVFAQATQLGRNIVLELAPDDSWLDAYEARLARDVLGPLRVALPDDPGASPLEVVVD